jgi:hypothetical protein
MLTKETRSVIPTMPPKGKSQYKQDLKKHNILFTHKTGMRLASQQYSNSKELIY